MQAILISIYLMLCLRTLKCCDCNLENIIKDTVMKGSSITIEKRQMHDDEDDSAEMMVDSEKTEGMTATTVETTKSLVLKSTESTEKSMQDENNSCMFYKDVPQFSFDNMADVWKIAFYKAFDKLSCFKIHIKKTTVEDRKIWQDKYGDFNDTIDWKNCQFEVASSVLKTGRSERRHFLQGTKEDKGVFDNIILTENEQGKTMTLLEQSPDQWLVVNHLLLMRDCDNGDVVVFSRLPIEPSLRDIEDALTRFGEDASNGTLACETLRDPKYQTLS